MSDSSCENINTIPQYTGTCWFNAFLTVLFYSDGMRKFFSKHNAFKKTKASSDGSDIRDKMESLHKYNVMKTEQTKKPDRKDVLDLCLIHHLY